MCAVTRCLVFRRGNPVSGNPVSVHQKGNPERGNPVSERGNPVSVHHSCPKRRTDTGLREGNPVSKSGEIRCQLVSKSGVSEIRCQFIILAQKDEPTPDYAKRRTDTEFWCMTLNSGAKRRTDTGLPDTEFRCKKRNRHRITRKDELTPNSGVRKDELTPNSGVRTPNSGANSGPGRPGWSPTQASGKEVTSPPPPPGSRGALLLPSPLRTTRKPFGLCRSSLSQGSLRNPVGHKCTTCTILVWS